MNQHDCCAPEGAPTEHSVGPFTYRSPPSPLTPAIRAFLKAARDGQWLLRDTTRELVRSFGLSAEDAGRAIADDVREQA